MEGGFGKQCPKCGAVAALDWQRWMGPIQVIGAIGFLAVLQFPWQVMVVLTALVAANAFLRHKSRTAALTREEIAKQEQNAGRPNLLRVANLGVALSGAFFLVSFMVAFVMFMNARERRQRLSEGHYHASTFRVLRSYWQKGRPSTLGQGFSSESRTAARGLVDGHEESMDLQPLLGFVPKDEETVVRLVPPGTEIPVYYDPELRGDYRVRFRGDSPPGVASRNAMPVIAKYGVVALAVTGILLIAFLRLRRFSLRPA